MLFPDIAKELLELEQKDLEVRDALLEKNELSDGYHPEMEAVHQYNTATLAVIMDHIGYPTVEKVGKKGSAAAWLVIQYSIGNSTFMKRCCKKLGQAVHNGQADPIHLAYLTDRIAVLERSPQPYGTQFDYSAEGLLVPCPFDDIVAVNRRRSKLGLNTIEEQTEVMRIRAGLEGQRPPIDLEKHKRDYEAWRRKTGWAKCNG